MPPDPIRARPATANGREFFDAWNPLGHEERLVGLATYARIQQGHLAPFADEAMRLATSGTLHEAADFALRYEAAIAKMKTGEALAMAAFVVAHGEAFAQASAERESLHGVVVFDLNNHAKIRRPLENLLDVIDLFEDPGMPDSAELRMHLAHGALHHVATLLREGIGDTLALIAPHGLKRAAREKWRKDHLFAEQSRLADFFNLVWVPKLSLPLNRLRNAMSHGDVRITSEGLRVEEGNKSVLVSPEEVERYIQAGLWAAFGFHVETLLLATKLARRVPNLGPVWILGPPTRE